MSCSKKCLGQNPQVSHQLAVYGAGLRCLSLTECQVCRKPKSLLNKNALDVNQLFIVVVSAKQPTGQGAKKLLFPQH